MSGWTRQAWAFTVPAILLLLTSCSQGDAPSDGSSSAATSAVTASSGLPTSESSASTPKSVTLTEDDFAVVNGTLSTACRPDKQMNFRAGEEDASENRIVDLSSGDWVTLPQPEPLPSNESQEMPTRCALTGDPKDPLVVFTRDVLTAASGIEGEKKRPELFALRVRDGDRAEKIDLVPLLSPGTYVEELGSYDGGLWILEGDVESKSDGLKLINFDDDNKPTALTIVPFPAQLDVRVTDATDRLLEYSPPSLESPNVNVIELPAGQRAPISDKAGEVALDGRYLFYKDPGDEPRTRPLKILDTVSEKTVTTPYLDSTFGDAASVSTWGDLVKLNSEYVVNVSSGEVLLDIRDQSEVAPNDLAGKYLYVNDGQKNPVIDLESKKTVSDGWTKRPILDLDGWTMVVTYAPGYDYSNDLSGEDTVSSCVGEDKTCELVPDNSEGEYPGPWW